VKSVTSRAMVGQHQSLVLLVCGEFAQVQCGAICLYMVNSVSNSIIMCTLHVFLCFPQVASCMFETTTT
jgi:hypothetical protein